jgi:hypothetical protein
MKLQTQQLVAELRVYGVPHIEAAAFVAEIQYNIRRAMFWGGVIGFSLGSVAMLIVCLGVFAGGA